MALSDNQKILCVDDDVNILAAYQRTLRKQFNLETAAGAEQALELIGKSGPYAVIVSDMNMPGMNGIQFLSRARELSPETVRMMLTGNADLNTAVQALHEGSIFQFLIKPCPPESLTLALDAALRQHQLIVAEKDLLEKTLQGSIKVLVEILAMVDPDSFGRAQALRQDMRVLAEYLGLKDRWKLELAAMLGQIGLVTIPTTVLRRLRAGHPPTDTEKYMLARVPQISHNLLVNIPRLEEVAQIVLYQAKGFDGSGFPADAITGVSIPLGARMLRVLMDLMESTAHGTTRPGALALMRRQLERYDPRVLEAATACFGASGEGKNLPARPAVPIRIQDLAMGQVLAGDVVTCEGTLLISAGHRVTPTLLERISNFRETTGLREPIFVEAA